MELITAVDGSPLAPESIRMLEYLARRAAELDIAAIRDRIRAAARELETVAAEFGESQARLHPIPGKWCAAEVVDHIAQTQARGAEELRHLLAGRRPPLPPVYEALRSGAAQWAPWNVLVDDLRDANRAMIDVLDVREEPSSAGAPTVKTLVVALRKCEDGGTASQLFFAELGWKQYALLQRLHLLDHRTQMRNLLAQIAGTEPLPSPDPGFSRSVK